MSSPASRRTGSRPSLVSDLGYSGWAQFPDGEIYVVNYIVDDAPKAHLRGYAFREEDLTIG